MKKELQLLSIILAFITSLANAQLAPESTGPDFTGKDVITDLNFNLYKTLNQSKPVVLDVSAHWCGPCWNYHQSGVLEDVWNSYGPDGTDEIEVVWADGSSNPLSTLSLLQGASGSQGNWLNGTSFHVIGPNNQGKTISNLYQVSYFPTIYMVCPDRETTELGQLQNATDFYNWQKSKCNKLSGANNVAVVFPATSTKNYCGTFTPSIKLKNLGNKAVTSVTVTVSVNGNLIETKNWTGVLTANGGAQMVTFNPIAPTSFPATVEFKVTNPNGVADENDVDNVYKYVIGPSSLTLNLTVRTDGYPKEISWQIKDVGGNTLFSGPPPADTGKYQTYNYTYNLPSTGCYTFSVADSYGDGIGGGQMLLQGTNNSIIFNQTDYGSGKSENFSAEANAPSMTFFSTPVAPDDLTADKLTGKISLTWTDNASDESGFVVERKVKSSGTWTVLNKVSANVTNYDDAAGTTVDTPYYRIRAYNDNGSSGYSNVAKVLNLTKIDEKGVDNNVMALTINPNLASDFIQVSLHLIQKSNVQVSIINTIGQEVYQTALGNQSGSNNLRINTSELNPGVYFLKVKANENSITEKVVIQR